MAPRAKRNRASPRGAAPRPGEPWLAGAVLVLVAVEVCRVPRPRVVGCQTSSFMGHGPASLAPEKDRAMALPKVQHTRSVTDVSEAAQARHPEEPGRPSHTSSSKAAEPRRRSGCPRSRRDDRAARDGEAGCSGNDRVLAQQMPARRGTERFWEEPRRGRAGRCT